MALRGIFKFRNADSSSDMNERFKTFQMGVYYNGVIAPIPSTLNISLQEFKAISNDGMVVIEDTQQTLTIPAGQTSYVVTRAKYNSSSNPTLSHEVLEESVYNSDIDKSFLIIHAKIVIAGGATQVLAGDIDETVKSTIDTLGRKTVRGTLTSSGNLPAITEPNRVGDTYTVTNGAGDTPEIYIWNGSAWVNVTNSGSIAQDLLDHRQNLIADEKHLTDDQLDAAGGSSGIPSDTNRFITQADPKIPSQGENDALVGSNGSPSSSNKYITESRPVTESTSLVFSSTPANLVLDGSINGPIYVGTGLVGTANKFFKLIDSTSKSIYKVAGSDTYVSVTGVFKDQPLTVELVPGSDGGVDVDGYWTTGNLYLKASVVPDTGLTVLYGRKQTISSESKGREVLSGPQDYPFQQEISQAISDIKKSPVDTPLAAGLDLPSLNTKIGDQRKYLNTALSTDLIVSGKDYPRLQASTDAQDFSSNIGISMINNFTNTGLISFSYTPGTGVIQYSSAVDLSGVVANNLFIDGDENTFVISAVNDGLDNLTISANQSVNSTVTENSHGSVRQDNNPLNLTLSDLKSAYGIERLILQKALRLETSFEADGSPKFKVVTTESSAVDDRIVLGGEWSSSLKSTNDATITITFFGTGLNLLVSDMVTLPSTVNWKINNVAQSSFDPTQTATVNIAFNSGTRHIPIVTDLTQNINTIELSFDTASNLFALKGFEIINESPDILTLTGRGYINTVLGKIDTLVNTTIPTTFSKGGTLTNYLRGTDLTVQSTSSPITEFSTTGISDSTSVINTVNSVSGFVINQIIRVSRNSGSPIEHYGKITALSADTVTLDSAVPFSDGVTLDFILNASQLADHTEEKIGFRLSYSNLITPTGVPSDVVGSSGDNTTILVGDNVATTTSGISGTSVALTGSGTDLVRFTFVGSGLDVIIANTSTVSPVVIIDGIHTETLSTIGGNGLERIKLMSDAPYGSHTVEITLNGLALVDFIIYERIKDTFSGAGLMTTNVVGSYIKGNDSDNNAISFGTIFKGTGSDIVFKQGTGGTSDWATVSNINLAARTGLLKQTDRTNGEIQFNFYGTGFNYEYLAGSDKGISQVILDGVVMTAVNYPGASLTGAGFNTGDASLDLYNASSVVNQKLFVSDLSLDYHTVIIKNTGTKNASSSGFFLTISGTNILAPLWTNVIDRFGIHEGNNSLLDIRRLSSFEDDNLTEISNLIEETIGPGDVYEEIDTTTANGINTLFTLPNNKTYRVGKKELMIFVNGLRKFPNGKDYDEVLQADGLGRTINFITPPPINAEVSFRIG